MKKLFIYICTIIVITLNIAMLAMNNNAEKNYSNMALIIIIILFFPKFIGLADSEKSSEISLILSGLIAMATYSLIILINRMDPLPEIVILPATIIYIGFAVFLGVIAVKKIFKNINRSN